MLAASDGEAEDPGGVVEEVEALCAGAGGEAGDDADLAEAAGAEGVAGFGVRAERAAADEVLVHLRAIEAADDGPDGGRRRLDALRQQGGALARPHGVAVVRFHRRPQLLVLRRRQPQPRRHLAVRARLLHRLGLDWIRWGGKGREGRRAEPLSWSASLFNKYTGGKMGNWDLGFLPLALLPSCLPRPSLCFALLPSVHSHPVLLAPGFAFFSSVLFTCYMLFSFWILDASSCELACLLL